MYSLRKVPSGSTCAVLVSVFSFILLVSSPRPRAVLPLCFTSSSGRKEVKKEEAAEARD
jgi:hypothetical protein